jgi:hypothetical protein
VGKWKKGEVVECEEGGERRGKKGVDEGWEGGEVDERRDCPFSSSLMTALTMLTHDVTRVLHCAARGKIVVRMKTL